MKFTIYGGKGEIGGNKILVEHKGTKIMLDFGMSFALASDYFSEFLQPRKSKGLTDFFELGLLPKIKGIYRNDYLKHTGMEPEEKGVDALLLSHAHVDHTQYLHFLRTDIPVYCTKATKVILQALEETGASGFSDFLTACEAFTFYKNKNDGLSRVDRRKTEYVTERPFNIMEAGKIITIGSLKVEMVPVDHSLPGACGFIIYSDEGNLVYTGDIRFHGYNSELSEKFLLKASSVKPKWLLTEGTRINQTKGSTELQVKKKISRLIKNSKGLVFVEHPIRDMDRVKTVYDASKENGRVFVVNLKLAYLINALGELAPFKLTDVKILVPPKSWGLIHKNVDSCLIDADYSEWERSFIKMPNAITSSELSKNQLKYVVCMNMFEIGNLIDIKPSNAIWIKSSCEPFSEEMEIDEERKVNWLKHFKIKHYHAHASGHAPGQEIRRLVKIINAEKVIPIHTEHEEMF